MRNHMKRTALKLPGHHLGGDDPFMAINFLAGFNRKAITQNFSKVQFSSLYPHTLEDFRRISTRQELKWFPPKCWVYQPGPRPCSPF